VSQWLPDEITRRDVALWVAAVLAAILVAVLVAFVLSVGDPSAIPGAGSSGGGESFVAFTFDQSQGDDGITVNVTHDGGDPVAASNLSLVVNGDARQWSGQASGTRDGESAVAPGDRATLTGLDPGTEIVVEYRDEETTEEISTYEVRTPTES